MCGIGGIVSLNNSPLKITEVVRLNNAIAHRGPDDEGYVLINPVEDNFIQCAGDTSNSSAKSTLPHINDSLGYNAAIALSHRRFSIIDTSPSGHQPFFDSQKSCCVVFNGEIYNYLELREKLTTQASISFRTNSDTEVLLEAYKFWGVDFIKELNGFWAFALYDFRIKKLFLSRDRLGKKPLYWAKKEDKLYFASEIKSLLACGIERKVETKNARLWLEFGLRDTSETTLFDGIRSFPTASIAEVDKSFNGTAERFWHIPSARKSEKDIPVESAVSSIRGLLLDSVKMRLRADVPLCVELSGGMDSSVLVALASQLNREKVTTYTVRFPDKEWNEEPFARSVANKFGVNYNVLESPTENFWHEILNFTYLEEEPYHSPNLHTNQVIWTSMRAEGMKVSLNGAAGDELFAGYGNYFYNSQLSYLSELDLNNFIKNLNWTESSGSLKTFISPFYYLWKNKFDFFPVKSLFGNKFPQNDFIKTAAVHSSPSGHLLGEFLLAEFQSQRIPYWLRSGDKGFMGIPLEVRAPFLDYRLVEYVMQLPESYLVREGWHKWILRKAFDDLLPGDVVWRRHKLGFPFPYNRFFDESSAVIDLILNNSDNPFLDFGKSASFRNNWNVLSFILWYEMFFNNNIELFRKIENIALTNGQRTDYSYSPLFLSHDLSGGV